jgi:hypothetical protein
MSALNRIEDNSFAAACYDSCTIEQLKNLLTRKADREDCEIWRLTPEEWREQIELAVAALEEKAV